MSRHVRFARSTEVTPTGRLMMLESLYDAPLAERITRSWDIEFVDDTDQWSVGLVVGPSGAGKSSLLAEIGVSEHLKWPDDEALFDALDPDSSARDVADALAAVGFNTIPSWTRPWRTLSNGEQFRADLAARLLRGRRDGLCVVDEFTSVVDRQVAKIAAHAASKYVRKHQFRFIAATCHEDVQDWLQPDFVCRPDDGSLTWRSVQPRPSVEYEAHRVQHAAWTTFAPYHYLTARLHVAAACYCAFVAGEPVAFTACLFRPTRSKPYNIMAASRTVVLPDWQGIGIGMSLTEQVASAYTGLGYRFHSSPSHPAYRAQRQKSPTWALVKDGSVIPSSRTSKTKQTGYRATPTYRYVGEPMPRDDALAFTGHQAFVP